MKALLLAATFVLSPYTAGPADFIGILPGPLAPLVEMGKHLPEALNAPVDENDHMSSQFVAPPAELQGEWIGETSHVYIQIEGAGFYYDFGPFVGPGHDPSSNAVDADCIISGQIEDGRGYYVSCNNGVLGHEMLFPETGVMEFNHVRFIRCTDDLESCD